MPMGRDNIISKQWPAYSFIVIALVGLYLSGIFNTLDLRFLDAQFSWLGRQQEEAKSGEITLVGIDEATFRKFREPLALWHPYFAKFLYAMQQGKAKAVVIDIVLPDRSFEFLAPGYDRQLLQAIRAVKGDYPLIIAQTIDETGELRPVFPPIISFAGKESVAVPLVKPDTDGYVRWFYPEYSTPATKLPTLVGALAKQLDMPAGTGIIDFSSGDPVDYISLAQVATWYDNADYHELEKSFKDRVVFIGAILPFEDRHQLPVGLAAWEPGNTVLPGVLIHAQAYRSLLHDGLIQPAPLWVVIALIVIASLAWWLRYPFLTSVIVLVVISSAAGIVAFFLLLQQIYLPVFSIVLSLWLAWLARQVLKARDTAREKQRLRNSFGGYVSPNVMQEIIKGKIHPNMQGERRRACILFSDIRNFTSRSENQDPEEIIQLLNRYFDEMTRIIHQHGGTVDKFIGDGLMAFFGAPNQEVSPTGDAFSASKEMFSGLDSLNATFIKQGYEPVNIGVGLHVGDVVVGHVGSNTRHEYTVIGDTVNAASRLEGLTKQLGYPLLVSDEVAKELDLPDSLMPLGVHAVKGRADMEVYGWKPVG